MKETLEEVAQSIFGLVNPILGKSDYRLGYERGLIEGAKWQQEKLLEFINDEDNHTEGELGNSCIDINSLLNFIGQEVRQNKNK
jgi:hypothetical protein